jgi:N-formylglutamate amidohydrolase
LARLPPPAATLASGLKRLLSGSQTGPGGKEEAIEDDRRWWTITRGEGPVVATAIHAGHAVRGDLAAHLALGEADRLREEDPYTDRWLGIVPNRVACHRSRFEVDLNRPRDGAVYRRPEDAWGLEVWRTPPPEEMIERSLGLYDAFYAELEELLCDLEARHGRFAVYDLHSYNHRRDGADAPPADPAGNPDVNLGTRSLPRHRWCGVADGFLEAIGGFDDGGRRLTVGENVRFGGGELARWVHRRFPDTGCALAIEIKKTFMDEWTGRPDPAEIERLGLALAATVPVVAGRLAC